MSRWDVLFARRLDGLATAGLRRQLVSRRPEAAARVTGNGRVLINFSSNDYLGLSRHPALIERAAAWADRWGVGAGASRLVTGSFELHRDIEAKIARFKGTEAALLFNSGWQANASILPALLRSEPGEAPVAIFADRLIHASLHHGLAAAGLRQQRFRHNDLNHLESLLAADRPAGERRAIITETVFGMDGDVADVTGLGWLARRYDAFLYLDEAHATGVLGPEGRGLSAAAPGAADLVMGTFSKAMGSFGAYVAGSRALCDYLVNQASGFVFATALPPPVLGAIDAALDLVPGMAAERQRLLGDAARLRDALDLRGIDTGPSTAQIVPALMGDPARALEASARLDAAGFLVGAIRPPTVPPGTSRLRFALSAAHRPEDIDALIGQLDQIRVEKAVA